MQNEAKKLATDLKKHQMKIVFAESCTGGLLCSELAKVSGISNYLCGSFVTYRSQSKVSWLGLSQKEVSRNEAVTSNVAQSMAQAALRKTPEAQISASITGHLGPHAPPQRDGLIYIAVALRVNLRQTRVFVRKHQLPKKGPHSTRLARRRLASQHAFAMVRSLLSQHVLEV